jgi:hypothetical protein
MDLSRKREKTVRPAFYRKMKSVDATPLLPPCADRLCPAKFIIRVDKLEKDLNIDPEDIEGLIPIVAQRTGRSLESTERNTYYGKVTTVGDILLFINSQPKIVT